MRYEEMSLRQKIGQMIVTGFPEESMSREFINLVEEYKVGNVILFQYNQKSRIQLKALCKELKKMIERETGFLPFITSDEEGGIVSRLPLDMPKMPSPLGQTALGEIERVRKAAKITGRELKEAGINFNLAPVLDINNNPNNPVIGVRSYGTTSQEVCTFGMAALKGYRDAKIMTTGKHFPGHGDTNQDSHLTLPTITKTWEELLQGELIPFQEAIRQGIPAITIAHICFPKVEPENIPATMSRKVITGLLREKLGFQGLIISDCMEMKAIKDTYGVAKGAVEAIKGGMDLIFISHTPKEVKKSIEAIEDGVQKGEISMERIDEALGRILYYKEKYGKTEKTMEEKEERENREFMEAFMEDVIAQSVKGGHSFFLGERPLFLSPVQTRVSLAANVQGEEESFARTMQEQFGGSAKILSMDPSYEERKEVINSLKGYSSLILGTVDGNRHEGQRKLIEEVGRCEIPCAYVALRNPFELESLPSHVFRLALYEYSTRAVEKCKKYFILKES